MKVLRVDGGLIGMERCEMIHGRKVLIEYTSGAHYRFIGTSDSKAGPLSHTQKAHIVKHLRQDGNPDLFMKNMLDNPLVPCNLEQEKDGNVFTRSVQNCDKVNIK